MNRQETLAIMSILKASYPAYYRGMGRIEADRIVNLWAEMFEAEDFTTVSMAVKALIKTRTSTFPPVVGEVSEKIQQITRPREMTEIEAWAYVEKALRNSAYNAEEEFSKLPPVVQTVVHAPEQLREWATMDLKTVASVIASNFQRSFRAKAKSEREFAALPEDVKNFAKALASNFELEPQQAEKPQKALPRRARTIADIQADLEEAKKIALEANKREIDEAVSFFGTISEDEWQKSKQEAIKKLLEVRR